MCLKQLGSGGLVIEIDLHLHPDPTVGMNMSQTWPPFFWYSFKIYDHEKKRPTESFNVFMP